MTADKPFYVNNVRLNDKRLTSLRKKLAIIIGVVAVAIIVALIYIWRPRGPIEGEVTIYGVNAAPYYTSAEFGLELTISGDVGEPLRVEVEFPTSAYAYGETIYAPFSGEKTVYVKTVMGGGPYWVEGGDYKLTIRRIGGTEVYYEKTFTFGGSGFSVVSYSPSTLPDWDTTMNFTMVNDGDFPSQCLGFANIYVEILYEGRWDNLVIGGSVDEGAFTLQPGDYKQFHIDISIPEIGRNQLRGQTRDVWLLGIGTTRPRFTLTFPSS